MVYNAKNGTMQVAGTAMDDIRLGAGGQEYSGKMATRKIRNGQRIAWGRGPDGDKDVIP
jgi:hypothetical protein